VCLGWPNPTAKPGRENEYLAEESPVSSRCEAADFPGAHEREFLLRYDSLYKVCVRLTEGDRSLAEDLLHDAFLHFVNGQPNLDAVTNQDGYLYRLLRNVHLARFRQGAYRFTKTNVSDFESAGLALRQTANRQGQVEAQQDLLRVCTYALARKEHSRAASALILRFFYGYYPAEIAKIMQCPRDSIYQFLRMARIEAGSYLERKNGRSATGSTRLVEITRGIPTRDFLADLRGAMLELTGKACPSHDTLKELYARPRLLDVDLLAHIVGCSKCLDEVSRILGLPLLNTREPDETLGYERPPKDDGRNGEPPAAGAPPVESLRRRAREAFEHRPEELQVSVNGFFLSALHVSSKLTRQSVTVNLSEQVAFVEIASEQGVPLLLMNIEPPPEGEAKQTARVRLSDDRTLETTISFSGAWPILGVIYRDPLFDTAVARVEVGPRLVTIKNSNAATPGPIRRRHGTIVLANLWRAISASLRVFGVTPLYVPKLAASAVVLGLIAALLFYQLRSEVVSAGELLQRSAAADAKSYQNPDWVIRRSLSLEELEHKSARAVSRHRIEVWQSAKRGLKVRRLFDERDRLIAGEWSRSDGMKKVYRRRASETNRKEEEAEGDRRIETVLGANALWQLEPSANEFTSLVGEARAGEVEDRSGEYLIHYQPAGQVPSHGPVLVNATLRLTAKDLHPTEETLTIRQGVDVHEYRLSETALEHRAVNAVPQDVFEPDAALLETKLDSAVDRILAPASADSERALLGLEVEALFALDGIEANIEQQIGVKRTPAGKLQIQGIVASEERKREVLEALAIVSKNQKAEIIVKSVDDLLAEQAKADGRLDVMEGTVEPAKDAFPAHALLQEYFARQWESRPQIQEGRVREEWLEIEISKFAADAVRRSVDVQQHASVLQDLASRLTRDQVRQLDELSQLRLITMIERHRHAIEQESGDLRQQLATALAAYAPQAENDASSQSGMSLRQTDLRSAAERIHDLSAWNQADALAVFTATELSPGAVIAMSRETYERLEEVEQLARRFRFQ
jgi:DNA-directed RNA polymerase specialized sigma24 family protein